MTKPNKKPRNLLHDHPLLRKGGVHDKTRKAKRRQEKQALRKAWFFPSTWFDRVLGKDRASRPCAMLSAPGPAVSPGW